MLSQLFYQNQRCASLYIQMMLAGVLMECVCNLRMLHRNGDLKANKRVHTVAEWPCADTACVMRVQRHLAVVRTH